jgi:tRNA threonylcarbamoyladenosine biosynthesis protein TsaE
LEALKLISSSPEDTLKIANSIGSKLKGSEVIELISDLGGGKTTFVKGLANGFGAKGNVHSPSFTLNNEYKAKYFSLQHYDFYRLDSAETIRASLQEVLQDQMAVVVIEWADIIKDVLPDKRLAINFRVTQENEREIVINYPDELKYLLTDVDINS